MKAAPLSPNEEERQKLLRHLENLGGGPQEFFDAVTHAVRLACAVPVAMVCLTNDSQRVLQVKAEPGATTESSEGRLCAKIMALEDIIVVPDARDDPRFAGDPAVSQANGIRFLAAVPLRLTQRISAGALCIMDYRPHILDRRQRALLERFSAITVSLLKLQLEKLEASREFGSLVMVKEKLQFQKEQMEAILDNEPESVTILSAQGELEHINNAGLEMLELASLAEARKHKPVEYVLPEFRGRFSELQNRVFRGERAIAEYKVRGARGTERWLESHATPLYDQQGRIISLIAISRDVTAIKESRKQLELAARVFAEAQEGIIIADATSTILDVNPAFCAITGYRREEVLGKTPRILHSGLQGPEFYAALWKTLTETGRWKGEIWNRKKNGDLYAELISINALRDEAGNPIYYVGLFIDITEIKRREGVIPAARP